MSCDAGGVAALAVELLYGSRPQLDARAIAETVKKSLPNTTVIADEPGILLAHEDYPVEFEEGTKAVSGSTLLVAEMIGAGRPAKDRVNGFLTTVRAVIEHAPPNAIHSPAAQEALSTRDLDESKIGAFLFDLAAYALENPGFENGDTVGEDGWKVQFEQAMAAPQRIVLDVDPGAPYAAGERSS